MSFVKMYSAILDSSVWMESTNTRIVWMTMLIMADSEGLVEASLTGLARRSRVSRDECNSALKCLEGPDLESRDETTGERIKKIPGGWLILNHKKYRDRRSQTQVDTARRTREWRKRKKVDNGRVTSDAVTGGDRHCDDVPRVTAEEIRSDQIRSEREERAGARGTLLSGLRLGFERRYRDALTVTPRQTQNYAKAIAGIVDWVLEQDRDPTKLCQQLLDGFFANEKARSKKFPISFLAHSPAEYLQLNGGSAPPQDRETRNRIADLRKQHKRSRVDQADCKREGNRHGVAECEADQKIIVRELQSLGATLAR